MATKKVAAVTKKTGTVKASAGKAATGKAETAKISTTEKAPETKAEMPEKKEAAAKAPVKKEAAAKAPVKKAPAKKASAKKEVKVKAVVEYYGKQVDEKDIIANVKKAWTKSGKKVGDIKTIDLYIKPEEGAVYYVINGGDTGAVAF